MRSTQRSLTLECCKLKSRRHADSFVAVVVLFFVLSGTAFSDSVTTSGDGERREEAQESVKVAESENVEEANDKQPVASPAALVVPSELEEMLSSLPECGGFKNDVTPREHWDEACDRDLLNDEHEREKRRERLRSLTAEEAQRIPEQKTWVCPPEPKSPEEKLNWWTQGYEDTSRGPAVIGSQVHWIVRNDSSGPVVISYVDAYLQMEVSPLDPDIQTPFDDNAILLPGEWRSIYAYQGHVFTVRELHERIKYQEMSGGDTKHEQDEQNTNRWEVGKVLLRHRSGLIPVRNRSTVKFDCSHPNVRSDPPPPHPPLPFNATEDERILQEEDVNLRHGRTEENYMELCNVLHVGFINCVDCPVDVYWAGGSDLPDSSTQSAPDHHHTYTAPDCHEEFKFHLGINQNPENYADDWDSPIAFEGTYLTHRFVARLRHEPSVVVDEIVLEPGVVRDCPVNNENQEHVEKGNDGVEQHAPSTLLTPPSEVEEEDQKETPWGGDVAEVPTQNKEEHIVRHDKENLGEAKDKAGAYVDVTSTGFVEEVSTDKEGNATVLQKIMDMIGHVEGKANMTLPRSSVTV